MKLPKNVVAAINTYYAFRGDEAYKNNFGEWKHVCLEEIQYACQQAKIEFTASAGTFSLTKGKETVHVSSPIMLNCREVKANRQFS
jgi:hypothetical protein